MDAVRAVPHRLPVGFEGEVSRLVFGTLAGALGLLQGPASATPDPGLRRQCHDGLERLSMRHQALARALSRQARRQRPSDEGEAPRVVHRATPLSEAAQELDGATAHVLQSLLDASESTGQSPVHADSTVGTAPAWPPPAHCAAALRWAVELASAEHAVRIELLRLGQHVLPAQFAAVCRRLEAGHAEREPAAHPTPPLASEATPADLIEAVRPGQWFRMVLLGQWADARVTWRSANGRFFMFSSELAGRSHSISRDSLQRLIECGRFRPLGPRSCAPARSGSETVNHPGVRLS